MAENVIFPDMGVAPVSKWGVVAKFTPYQEERAMFMREKKSGKYEYVQVVHNKRVEGKVKQNVIATLGRLEVLQKSGEMDALLASGSRFANRVAVLDAHRRGKTPAVKTKRIGASVIFERLWKEAVCRR